MLFILIFAAAVPAQFIALPVFDAANLANAIERLAQLREQISQLVRTYDQLVLEYKHMLKMAKQLPGLSEHYFRSAPWRFSHSTDTYGTAAAWNKAINTGNTAEQAYRFAVERLATYGSALARIPADQLDRAKTDYAGVELADAANIHGIEVAGSQRAKAGSADAAISGLESASLSSDEDSNTQIAVLNKINAAGMMVMRASQDTNQILIALLEHQLAQSKARRDAEATAINANIAFRQHAYDAGIVGIRDTTKAITTFRMP
jgi:conjugal transfer/entry exclusion protein